jgi:predicted TIM-barrel fold metal-dependent hydrolase
VYIHAEPGEELIPEVIRVMGRNRLFYASDWPHWDNEYPDSLYHIWQREDLTEEQKRGILRDNAAEMYGLDNGS